MERYFSAPTSPRKEELVSGRISSFTKSLQQILSASASDLFINQMFNEKTSAAYVPDRIEELIMEHLSDDRETYIQSLIERIQSIEECFGQANVQQLEEIGSKLHEIATNQTEKVDEQRRQIRSLKSRLAAIQCSLLQASTAPKIKTSDGYALKIGLGKLSTALESLKVGLKEALDPRIVQFTKKECIEKVVSAYQSYQQKAAMQIARQGEIVESQKSRIEALAGENKSLAERLTSQEEATKEATDAAAESNGKLDAIQEEAKSKGVKMSSVLEKQRFMEKKLSLYQQMVADTKLQLIQLEANYLQNSNKTMEDRLKDLETENMKLKEKVADLDAHGQTQPSQVSVEENNLSLQSDASHSDDTSSTDDGTLSLKRQVMSCERFFPKPTEDKFTRSHVNLAVENQRLLRKVSMLEEEARNRERGIRQLNESAAHLQEDIEQKDSIIEKLISADKSKEDIRKNLEDEANKARDDIRVLKESIEHLQIEGRELESKVAQKEAELKAKNSETGEMEAKMQSLQTEIQGFSMNDHQQKAEIVALNSKISSYLKSSEEEKAKSLDLAKKIEEFESKNQAKAEEYSTQVKKLITEKVNLKAAYESSAEKVDSLQNELSELASRFKAQSSTLNTIQEKLSTMEKANNQMIQLLLSEDLSLQKVPLLTFELKNQSDPLYLAKELVANAEKMKYYVTSLQSAAPELQIGDIPGKLADLIKENKSMSETQTKALSIVEARLPKDLLRRIGMLKSVTANYAGREDQIKTLVPNYSFEDLPQIIQAIIGENDCSKKFEKSLQDSLNIESFDSIFDLLNEFNSIIGEKSFKESLNSIRSLKEKVGKSEEIQKQFGGSLQNLLTQYLSFKAYLESAQKAASAASFETIATAINSIKEKGQSSYDILVKLLKIFQPKLTIESPIDPALGGKIVALVAEFKRVSDETANQAEIVMNKARSVGCLPKNIVEALDQITEMAIEEEKRQANEKSHNDLGDLIKIHEEEKEVFAKMKDKDKKTIEDLRAKNREAQEEKSKAEDERMSETENWKKREKELSAKAELQGKVCAELILLAKGQPFDREMLGDQTDLPSEVINRKQP